MFTFYLLIFGQLGPLFSDVLRMYEKIPMMIMVGMIIMMVMMVMWMIMMTKMTEKAYILCQKSDVLFIGGQEFDEESFPTRQSRPFSWKMKMSVQVKIKNAFSPVSEEKVEICPEMRNYYLWAPSPHPKVFMHFFAHLRTIYQESCHKSYSLSREYKTQDTLKTFFS